MTRRGTRRTLLSGIDELGATKAINAVSGLITYYPAQETTGTDLLGYDASGRNAGFDANIVSATIGQTATPALGLSQFCDGLNDYNDLPNAVGTVFVPAKGSIVQFVKMAAGAWTDGAFRVPYNIRTTVGTFIVTCQKSSANNTLEVLYYAAGTNKKVTHTISTYDWFMIGHTWDTTADELKMYINGTQVASTVTGLGLWSGTPTILFLGARDAATSYHHGNWCHWAMYDNAIGDANMLSIAQGGGVA